MACTSARCRLAEGLTTCPPSPRPPASQVLGQREPGDLFPEGVFTLEDIKDYGRQHSICPYFALRRMMPFVDVIIYSFHYLLDPKVAEQVSKELSGEAIVVFDEAHNIGSPPPRPLPASLLPSLFA